MEVDFPAFLDFGHLSKLPAFVIAAAIGLLIGLERERRPSARAGLRTCALTAMFGTLAAFIGETLNSAWMVPVGLLMVGGMIITAYLDDNEAPGAGTTTVIAVFIAYGLGVLTYLEEAHLAVTLGLGTTALLYFKTEFAGMMQRFERKDLLSVLQFGALSVVILPLLPDVGYGPYEALNPYRIWLMVMLIAGLSLAGFIALRLLGGKRSAVLLGVFGGMVSTTATTAAYSRYGRSAKTRALATLVILVANLVLLARLAILSIVVSPQFFVSHAAPVLGIAFLAGAVVTLLTSRGLDGQEDLPLPQATNPTEMRAALSFGLLFALVLLVSAWLRDIAGDKGLYIVAAVSGLTDVNAITLSSLQLHHTEEIVATTALTAIVIALFSNQIAKLAFVRAVGGRKLLRRCALPMAAPALAAAGATFFYVMGV